MPVHGGGRVLIVKKNRSPGEKALKEGAGVKADSARAMPLGNDIVDSVRVFENMAGSRAQEGEVTLYAAGSKKKNFLSKAGKAGPLLAKQTVSHAKQTMKIYGPTDSPKLALDRGYQKLFQHYAGKTGAVLQQER